jgi:PEP-CTERM motif
MLRIIVVLIALAIGGAPIARATTYNVDASVGGTVLIGSSCVASNCNESFLTQLFTFAPGSTVDFGSLTFNPFVYSDGGFAVGHPYLTLYVGTLSLAGPFSPIFPIATGFAGAPCLAVTPTSCSFSVPPPTTTDLLFTNVSQIQFEWTLPASYSAPTFLGAVPEPSIWAMLLMGLAGIGFASYRKRRLWGVFQVSMI